MENYNTVLKHDRLIVEIDTINIPNTDVQKRTLNRYKIYDGNPFVGLGY